MHRPHFLTRLSRRGCLAALIVTLVAGATHGTEPIRVLIVDGQNNHNWQDTTPYIQSFLTETGRFDVEVVTTPEKGAPEEAWNGFRPDFSKYDVVLSNYNGETWPESVRQDFEKFVTEGGGMVNVHAANNPFATGTPSIR